MRRTTTALLAATAAIPLSLAVAAPAAAAPEDVTVEFSSAVDPNGVNTVTGTFTFRNGAAPTFCAFGDITEITDIDFDDDVTNPILYAFQDSVPEGTSLVLADPVVADGTYTIDWACRVYGGDGLEVEGWGTPDAGIPGGATAEPMTITVPDLTPPDPEPVCTGSSCLPTGSFGF